MKNRHLILKILFLLLTVPFVFSCGIPTEGAFCNINFLSIENKTPTTENTLEFGFSLKNNYEDYTKIKNGPSLILFYVLGEDASDVSSSYQTSIKSAIESKLSESPIVSFSKNEPFLESNGFKVYPFFVASSKDVPMYSDYTLNFQKIIIDDIGTTLKNMSSNKELKTRVFIKTDNSDLGENQTGTQFSISAKKDETSLGPVLISLQNSETPYENYAFIFAVMTPGIGTFKVPSWSDCYYLGSLKLDK